MIRAVIFDFGGVLAEEGFREGLMFIAKKNGIDPDPFFSRADELVYSTGYLTGKATEDDFMNAVRKETGITGSNAELKEEIMRRFVIRPRMIDLVQQIRSCGIITAILSDQTNWLDEINHATPFFHLFDRVFNSFALHKSKRDPSVFQDVCSAIDVQTEETLFVDDNEHHISRASAAGLRTIHFTSTDDFALEIVKHLPQLLAESGI